MAKYFIFRNSTIEPLFQENEFYFSGYEDISIIPKEAENYIWFYLIPFKYNRKLLSEEIGSYSKNLLYVANQISRNKTFIIFTIHDFHSINLITGDFVLAKAIVDYNMKIINLAEQNKNIKIIDISRFTGKYTTEQLIDWKYFYLSKMQINPKLAKEFAYWFRNQIDAINYSRKKCIVLDLDNTLWGGILGEDGFDGIKIGGDYPGNAFQEFQEWLLEISKTGIILAICSKNNESDVLEAWEKNKNILLKKENFATYRINWKNKSENIKEIANELNIGFESIVFIDDNPTERELIKQYFPMIETPIFPLKPYLLPLFTKKLSEVYFRTYSLLAEDRLKTEQYRANSERNSLQKEFSDFVEYLNSLEIEINMQRANSGNIERIVQLTQKTNQFNLTTIRYSQTEILTLIEQGNWVYCINVKDKFGDSGITGVIILIIDKEQKSAIIDSLLLSCRILGKHIEEAFVYSILNKLKQEGIYNVYASFKKTAKNEQVKNFYEKIGFEIVEINGNIDDEKKYRINLKMKEFIVKSSYKITEI